MGLRDNLKRLERAARGEMVEIPQVDGSVKRFPQSAMQEAYVNEYRRLCGEDLVPHELTLAAANSSSAEWSRSAFADMHVEGDGPPVDLSE